ncbi:MAG: hypothetical protein A2Y04_05255 [Omnitrophica WOR_2 bacterium GWC2_45_7]|nr:MAG: hypothetical protein A2Y04_05255 [Omnitrophica WOR_2 bacterium GWC2_45_7]
MSLSRMDHKISAEQLRNHVAEHIHQLIGQTDPVANPQKILRIEFPCESVNVLAWLNQQKGYEKIYWLDRAGELEMAGLGVADILQGERNPDVQKIFAYFQSRLSSKFPRLRYYGGLSFDKMPMNTEWQPFGQYRFWIPRFELLQTQSDTFFAINLTCEDIRQKNIEPLLLEVSALQFPSLESRKFLPKLLARSDQPNKEDWDKLFVKVKSQLKTGGYEKVVLARKSLLRFSDPLNPMDLVERLKSQTENCFHFCFQVSPDAAFLGATPERLYKRIGRAIESEAIAGTKPRGLTLHEDEQFRNELLNSTKDAAEHRYVVDFIRNAFIEMCADLTFDPFANLLQLKGGHHLITRFSGRLKNGVEDDHILTSLHPTPAVGGYPAQEALKTIEETEPFNRGWYAGPVGYVGYDSVELVVAIRSGLIHQNSLSLYAGAGIVAASQSKEEWDEIENKIGSFINVLNS